MIDSAVDAIIMALLRWRYRRYRKRAWSNQAAALSFNLWAKAWLDGCEDDNYHPYVIRQQRI